MAPIQAPMGVVLGGFPHQSSDGEIASRTRGMADSDPVRRSKGCADPTLPDSAT